MQFMLLIRIMNAVYSLVERRWYEERYGRSEVNWSHSSRGGSTSRQALRVGYVPLCDCAPLVMARELGLFEKFGLAVELSREVGWATIRDKIFYGELEAAHALAPMPMMAS